MTTKSNAKPGSGPGPKALSGDDLDGILAAHQFGVLASNKRNGRPHLTTMAYVWDPAERVLRISTTADRAKVRQLRRDPRAALHVSGGDFWSFVVAEGEVELSEISTTPGDAAGRELLKLRPPFDDPAEENAFLEQMVADRRLVIRLRVERTYGTALDLAG
ncbi:PPOX class F420-dependent oxidoreductase [Amycolatopsis nigrescens]|uniref:PPOX class F420-dependent oxidoreductase n=1 Tax=Amycolatopsis nigrescens TaxID=381445 RepID=UPI00037163C6|nr:PPOX class F420-dependent oxidoreductase [Amycolatopsis nigrescens]